MQSPSDQSPHRFEYQRQDCALSLAEGLAEYYRCHPELIRPDAVSPESAALFRSHDICHVIFGLDTTIVDEAIADLRTVLSTDVGLRRYLRYLRTNKEAQAIFQRVGWLAVFGATLRAIPRFSRALVQALRAGRRWPWNPPQHHLGTPLGSLRAAYGIRVL